MKISKIQKGLVLVTVALGMFAIGCELIVDFDRTLIPVEETDGATLDVNVPDTTPPAEAGGDADATTEPDADAGEGTDSGDADAATDADADR